MKVNVGSVWMKNPNHWNVEGGQLVIVEGVTKDTISYRYCGTVIHGNASWPTENFLRRMILIVDVN